MDGCGSTATGDTGEGVFLSVTRLFPPKEPELLFLMQLNMGQAQHVHFGEVFLDSVSPS